MGLEIINKLKKEKGITSKQLAEMSNVPLGTLNKILTGITKDPKLETLKSLAKVLGCTLDDFDDESENKNTNITLNSTETDLITKYRNVPENIKEDIRDYIDMKYNKFNEECATVEDDYIIKRA